MRKFILFSLILMAGNAQAEPFGNAELGKIKSPSCVFCHGETGEALNPRYPHLNGQNAQYLYQSMLDYKNGKRTSPMGQMMKAQLKQLDEQDLKDIAAFYAEQK